ncbi:MAG: CsgG/HfaB family protein [bacterium]|nr:PEGA domain-containing protein [candidate division KSB1 bacterium]MDH7560045.1 CsgG/HfaB family protein [bacterium]
MKKSLLCAAVLAAALLAPSLYSQTARLRTAAVLELDTRMAVSRAEAGTLTDRLRSMLVRTRRLSVVERGKMEDLLREAGFQQTGCTTTECAVQVGRILNAEFMISGSVGRIGRVYTIDINVIDVESASIVNSISEDYRGEIEGLLDLMRPIADQLADFMEKHRPVLPEVGTLKVLTLPVPAEVFLDGNPVGESPVQIDTLTPGEHVVRVSVRE